MSEICERPHALARFLRNRRADFRSRAELNYFRRVGISDGLQEVELSATPEEIVLRLVSQKRRVLSLLKKGERLTPPWARFAERHGDDLARLAQII